MNSSCRAAVISSKTFITSVALHRNGLILRFLVRNKCSFFFFFFPALWSRLCSLQTFSFLLNLSLSMCLPVRWYALLQIHVRHEQYRVGLQVHRYRWSQRKVPDRYFTSDQRKGPRQTYSKVSVDHKLFLLMIMSSFPSRLWDTKANVGRWRANWPLATGWHLGVAGGCGLSPDRKPAPQSHSPVAPPPAVPIPDVRAQHCSCLLFLWLLHCYLSFNCMVVLSCKNT